MATTSLQSLHKPQPFLPHPQPLHHHPLPPNKLSFNPSPPSLSLSSSSSTTTTTTFSLLTPTVSSTTSPSFDALAHHLSASDYRQADEETRRLIIALAGEPAQKRGYVFFSEVQFIASSDLQAIDRLWRKHSGERFGYSVQKRIWHKAKRDFTSFFIKVGWMRRLGTEVEQWNYRSFPEEFVWELKDDTPDGHLPLTNALRGTQLLTSILTHPAFDEEEDEKMVEDSDDDDATKRRPRLMGGTMSLKPDYSF